MQYPDFSGFVDNQDIQSITSGLSLKSSDKGMKKCEQLESKPKIENTCSV